MEGEKFPSCVAIILKLIKIIMIPRGKIEEIDNTQKTK